MKARIPKSWQSLPKSQRDKLTEYTKDVALEAAKQQLEKDMRIMLDLYIKMVCMVLHEAFGFGEKRLRMFLGNHRREFRRQYKLVDKGEQIEYLDKRMAEIFKKDGFPKEFLDNLIGAVEVVDE